MKDWDGGKMVRLIILIAAILILAGVVAFVSSRGEGNYWVALGSLGQYVEAIVVTVTAVAVYGQIKRWSEESAQHKFHGFKFIQDVFESEKFQDCVRAVQKGGTFMKGDAERGPLKLFSPKGSAPFLLAQLDMVAFFAEKGYVDGEVLLEYGARRMSRIADSLDKLDLAEPEDDWVKSALKLRPRAARLLEEAREYWRQKGTDEAQSNARD